MAALPNEYEEQRRQRMLANQQRLQELGLLDAANPLSGAAEANRAVAVGRQRQRSRAEAAEAPPPEPTRRSRRMRGEAAENVGMQLGEGGASSGYARRECGSSGVAAAAPRVRVDLDALAAAGADPAVDAHNLMRVRSMSERALQTRIWKIRRADKLASFVAVLEACGMAELAAEAREALAQMCGGAAPPV